MPTIYDNINAKLTEGLRAAMVGARRADFCAGYFNLRGWRELEPSVAALSGENGDYCRLLVGMSQDPERQIRRHYAAAPASRMTQGEVVKLKRRMVAAFAAQLAAGAPTNEDESALTRLAAQLREGTLRVKLCARHPLHAKLYLVHRADRIAAITGFVGSSNLTLAGMERNGELNVDVVEQDAARKLAEWFEERWQDDWSMDISADLAEIIAQSWAGGPREPYHLYIKTAWHLSREAAEEAERFRLPAELSRKLLEHQKRAISLAAQRLNRRRGVIIGDVVGLGKTLVAAAVAKVFQEDHGDNVLVICPPALLENWQNSLGDCNVAGKTLSLGMTRQLEKTRRYRLLIVDESHNLRNRKTARHRHLREYIRANESRVILLTATPYNKDLRDIADQLRLFVDPGEDLGIYPDALLAIRGGVNGFSAKHPNILPTSLAAFEQSEEMDDWRELMRLFMVRRTRAHVKENYAEKDEAKDRHYLTFADGDRFYFPKRRPKCLRFSLRDGDEDDQYAKLYTPEVAAIVAGLSLPRYGLAKYKDSQAAQSANEDEKTILDNLSRAGRRLCGFARSNLFKRLESGGDAFLLSVRRHILRNAALSAALAEGGDLPLGAMDADFRPSDDDDGDDSEIWQDPQDGPAAADPLAAAADIAQIPDDWEAWQKAGAGLLRAMRQAPQKFQWIGGRFFAPALAADLRKDADSLRQILRIVPRWDPSKDRKLQALRRLCEEEQKGEKILIFTQYKDTMDYIHRTLFAGASDAAALHGGVSAAEAQSVIKRFAPRANGASRKDAARELRILTATDKLSEGVNLQDGRIIVNYDLPWALIRLVQRAGRVDRIGQTAETILCYSALPEDGIDRIINLRRRLADRMRENQELLGSDEEFFEGENSQAIRRLYEENLNLEGADEDGETDLISRADEIWRRAIRRDPKMESIVKAMPDVVYSAKAAKAAGVIAYIRDSRARHALAHLNARGGVESRSQHKILNLLACPPDEPAVQVAENHHANVRIAVEECRRAAESLGGQLGGENSVRRRAYDRMIAYAHEKSGTLFEKDAEDLENAINQILQWPLRDAARDRIGRQMRAGVGDYDLAKMIQNFWRADELCDKPKADLDGEDAAAPQIICSMGLAGECP